MTKNPRARGSKNPRRQAGLYRGWRADDPSDKPRLRSEYIGGIVNEFGETIAITTREHRDFILAALNHGLSPRVKNTKGNKRKKKS